MDKEKSGFVELPPHPDGWVPKHNHPYNLERPSQKELEEMPDWYRKQMVEIGPMIDTYNLTDDPIENAPPIKKYYTKPDAPAEHSIERDESRMGENAFDEFKVYRQKMMPELSSGKFEPLPLYKEVSGKDKVPDETEKVKEKSKKLREERQEKKKQQSYDPDLLLPNLPWETDPVIDPYRGIVEKNAVSFHKPTLERAFTVYKEFLTQRLVEFVNLSGTTNEQQCERLMFDAVEQIRLGQVGDLPTIAKEHDEVFRLVFEGHMKQFIADWLKFRGGRRPEAEAIKSEADELMKKAAAKSKLLGKAFADFMQEMTTRELDQVKQNPNQKYVIMCREKKHEILAKPFIHWMRTELDEFVQMEFEQPEHLEKMRELLLKHVNECKFKTPMRLEGVNDRIRDMVVESFYHWCRGSLQYFAGKHYMTMFLVHADSRFRSKAEDLFEESIEVYDCYFKCAKECGAFIPIPNAEPNYDFSDAEYLEGENGYHAELTGDLDRAERIWHTGTALRWYPMFDELDYLHYFERRGRISQAYEISDRSLSNMNQKTHPSLCPFPERGRKWLEGAPLTQETAEHLWFRYMGDLYCEHSEFNIRCGRIETGQDQLKTGLNFYHLAVRTAEERLPGTWIAPILTRAKLLSRLYYSGMNEFDPKEYINEVFSVLDSMTALSPLPPHWVNRLNDFHFRLDLLVKALPIISEVIRIEAEERTKSKLTEETMNKYIEQRAKKGAISAEFDPFIEIIEELAEPLWREKVLKYRAKEAAKSDHWHMFTLYYFAIRVRPKTPEEVEKYKEMIWPTYDYMYTQAALGVRTRSRLMNEMVRRLCQILTPGSVEQKKLLYAELEKLRTKLVHVLDKNELDRCLASLEKHLKDPQNPPYIYQDMYFHRINMKGKQRYQPATLNVSMGKLEYERMKKQFEDLRKSMPEAPALAKNPDAMDGPQLSDKAPSARDVVKESVN